MLCVHFIFLLTLQMQVFGKIFQIHSGQKESRSTSESREISLSGSMIENVKMEKMGNLTQHSNKPLHASLVARSTSDKITHPAVNLAHRRSSSRNAKGFWNEFLFRGKSDFRYILPIRNVEVRQEKCRALAFSQRISHENCETLELKNNVCFGTCAMAPSSGEDGSSCPVCSPVNFGSKTVKLTCIDNTEVIKVVALIEDCRCETKEGQQSHHNGPVLVDPSVDQYP